jgi:hypothetical protein
MVKRGDSSAGGKMLDHHYQKKIFLFFLFPLFFYCTSIPVARTEILKIKMMQDTKSTSDSIYLIDDFSQSGQSVIGNRWQSFSDRVMGGLSRGTHGFEILERRRCIRLRGEVSLENQGGFVQAALSLEKDRRPFDASQYRGIRISALGNGETYYIHMRTEQTGLPWQYYQASFKTSNKWKIVEIPFDRFVAENIGRILDPSRLTRIAIVAAKKAFKADVAVARLEFYR